jgi:NADH-quinone oxidoreductase subunit J
MIQTAVFYILSAILVFASVRVITAKNPVHAALYLVLAFFTSAGHWLLLESEFLAITLVLVYVGAVMVLFLFVVMMLDVNFEKLREGFWKNAPLAAVVGLVMVGEMVLILTSQPAGLSQFKAAAPLASDVSNVKLLGRQIYTTYLLPFEMASVVLTIGLVAAVALTLRHRKDTKFVDPGEQVKVRRDDRIRIVKMDAVKPVAEVAEAASSEQQA